MTGKMKWESRTEHFGARSRQSTRKEVETVTGWTGHKMAATISSTRKGSQHKLHVQNTKPGKS